MQGGSIQFVGKQTLLKKTLGVAVIFFAGIGLVLCLGALVSVWIVRAPVTNATTTLLQTVADHATYAGVTTAALSVEVANATEVVDMLRIRIAATTTDDGGEVRAAMQSRVIPAVETVRTTLATARSSVLALNSTLESLNRLPGIQAPTLTEELQVIDRRLDEISEILTALRAAAGDLSADGVQIDTILASTSDRLTALQSTLENWSIQSESARGWAEAGIRTAPGAIDLGAVVISLLALLFGAGQVCLIRRGIQIMHA